MKRSTRTLFKNSYASPRRSPNWSVTSLEKRLMLAADCGTAISHATEVAPACEISQASVAQTTSTQIVFIDPSVEDIDQLVDGLSANHEMVLLQPNENGLDQITDLLSQRSNVGSIHIVAHGKAGQIQLGNQLVDADAIQQKQSSLQAWSNSLTDSADILIYGCETGADASGLNLIDQIAKLTGADIAASTDKTGAESLDGDWVLERSVGAIESGLAFDLRTQLNYAAVMPITIRAQGTTGEENMALQIDGTTVATFENIGTQLKNFTYQTTTSARNSEIRVVFTNDLFDDVTGTDRNLIVDSVAVEGVTLQTESPNVYSTGTWKDGGITPGFKESEFLHSNGYFQYPIIGNATGSEIELIARGDEGTEEFSLLINGQNVASFTATTQFQTFTYTHNNTVAADDVRIQFTSDRWNEANGVDENLFVDYITIDGEIFQTEDPSVYSTGTWTAADGISPGFGRGEALHGEGYFQFAGNTNNGSRILVQARGHEGTESFNLVIDGEIARTYNVSSTDNFQTFAYTHTGTVGAEDIRIQFINDRYDEAQGIDENLDIDYISVDGKAYQTESPAVFSTGTWTPANGISPGFHESETLHGLGYFQFADSSYLVDTDAAGDGEWSDVEPLGIVPIHAIVLPDGKVFSFGTTELGMQGAQFVYSVYDPETGVEVVLPNTTDTDIFCSNMSIDPMTGNVMIFGGDARGEGGPVNGPVNDVLVFDYTDMTIRDATQGEMEYDRWYGSSVTLPNGEIMVLGGTGGGKDVPEVFNATTGWRTLTGVNMNINYYYPKTWVTSDGSVVAMSNSGAMYRINTTGTGSSQQIGTAGVPHSNASPGIMYDVDKIAFVGTNAKIYVGDLSAANPTFTAVADVLSARRDGGMSMLPDGRVLITGGSSQFNVLGTAVYATEIWDPNTNEVEVVEDVDLARLYHSTHLLLPDGTFWVAGGGAPGPLTNLNAEFYAPNYLYNADGSLADRPVITGAPSNVNNSATFTVSVDNANAIDRITAVRSGALTHAVNSDTRFVELSFNVINGNTIQVTTQGSNIMVPGTWMMFALDGDGTPSEAAMLGVGMATVVDTPHLLA